MPPEVFQLFGGSAYGEFESIKIFHVFLLVHYRVAKSPSEAFCSTESEKRRFRFPLQSMTCAGGHRFGRPVRGALMTCTGGHRFERPARGALMAFTKVIHFGSFTKTVNIITKMEI